MKNNQSSKLCYYAIGDIHGCYELLVNLIDLIEKDLDKKNTNILIFLGDYIDRGPDSNKVIDFLLEIQKEYKSIFLKGNHEDLLIRFINNPQKCSLLKINGGIPTLNSYGIDTSKIEQDKINTIEFSKLYQDIHDLFLEKVPKTHLNFFLNSLRLSYETEKYFFAHAGVRSNTKLSKQRAEDLIWIREPFLSESIKHEKIIIHGHSITPTVDIKKYRIGIDTGAYHSGELTAIKLWGEEISFLSTKKNHLKNKIINN